MEWIDTHCHLTFPPLAQDLPGVLDRAESAGLRALVASAFDSRSWEALERLPPRPGLWVTYGIHPWAAEEGGDLDELRQRASDQRCVAIGEIGLDFSAGRPAPEVQRAIFAGQLALAVELDLPVVIHCVRAFEALFEHLSALAQPVRGVIHGYTGSLELARRCLRAGLLIGLGGRLTDRPGRKLLHALSSLPPESLVLETDSPEGRFAGCSPGASEPSQVVEVGRVVAEVRGWTREQVAARTSENARRLLGIV